MIWGTRGTSSWGLICGQGTPHIWRHQGQGGHQHESQGVGVASQLHQQICLMMITVRSVPRSQVKSTEHWWAGVAAMVMPLGTLLLQSVGLLR